MKVIKILLVVAISILEGVGICVFQDISQPIGGCIMAIACILVLPVIELLLPKGQSLFKPRRE